VGGTELLQRTLGGASEGSKSVEPNIKKKEHKDIRNNGGKRGWFVGGEEVETTEEVKTSEGKHRKQQKLRVKVRGGGLRSPRDENKKKTRPWVGLGNWGGGEWGGKGVAHVIPCAATKRCNQKNQSGNVKFEKGVDPQNPLQPVESSRGDTSRAPGR